MDKQQIQVQKLQSLISSRKRKSSKDARPTGKDKTYWRLMGKLAYYVGLDAYLYAKHDLLTAEEGNELIKSITAIRAQETLDLAIAVRAANASKPAQFKSALKEYIRSARE